MKKRIVNLSTLVLAGLVMFACTSIPETSENQEDTPAYFLERIKEMDDSLELLVSRSLREKDFNIDRLVYHEAAMRNIGFYQQFPTHEFAPNALEKAAAMYMAINLDQRAAEWRDTLILHYPNFERMADILELQKSVYDNFDTYEPEMIKKYCSMLLELGDKISKEKRKEIEFRLENIELNFLELAILQNPGVEL